MKTGTGNKMRGIQKNKSIYESIYESIYDLRKLQLEQLTILDELKRVCTKNNLTFYLAYGTCLGAVRHKGFIPWDDDIDILMPVEDYDKLMERRGDFAEGFFLQNYDTDRGFKAAIARVRKHGTACIESQEAAWDCHQGIFIDIYPQYHYPDSLAGRMEIVASSILYRLLLLDQAPENHGRIAAGLGTLLLKLLHIGGKKEEKIKKYFDKLRKYQNTQYVADLYGRDLTAKGVIAYRQEWFQEPEWTVFEGRQMPIPTNARAFLRKRYGREFMELPPENEQKSYHHYVLVDFGAEDAHESVCIKENRC